MTFKKSRYDLEADVYSAAYSAASSRLYRLNNEPMSSMNSTISDAVASGIKEGMRVLMENVYTDAEFEEDVGLRAKSKT